MKIVNSLPPNYEAICEALPAVRPNKRAIFTYGDTIYVPGNVLKLPTELVAHEQVHSERQAAIGVESWWRQYLTDSDFRYDEELKAYQVQYQATKTYPRKMRRVILLNISKDLSSPMYGGVVGTWREALEQIKKGSAWLRNRNKNK